MSKIYLNVETVGGGTYFFEMPQEDALTLEEYMEIFTGVREYIRIQNTVFYYANVAAIWIEEEE